MNPGVPPTSPTGSPLSRPLLPAAWTTGAPAPARLSLELVPSTCWGSNFRDLVTAAAWGRIRRAVYQAAGHHCEICGGAGRRHPVECHERWSYDDATHVQRLDGFIALCPRCHAVKHLGRTGTVAKVEDKAWMLEAAVRHVCRVNGWTRDDLAAAYDAAFAQWERRSAQRWRLDLGALGAHGFSAAQIAELEADTDEFLRLLAAERRGVEDAAQIPAPRRHRGA